jgi:hypothetical protein
MLGSIYHQTDRYDRRTSTSVALAARRRDGRHPQPRNMAKSATPELEAGNKQNLATQIRQMRLGAPAAPTACVIFVTLQNFCKTALVKI